MQLDLETIARRVPHVNIIGSGGNINKIYRMASVKDTTTEQRIERFSLKEDRADVIVQAAEIFLRIANLVHAEFIHVPVIGLADGIIDELYEQTNRKCPCLYWSGFSSHLFCALFAMSYSLNIPLMKRK